MPVDSHNSLSRLTQLTQSLTSNTLLVLPKLEYAAPIWSPYSKLQINQIEKVQRTAARWACSRWRNIASDGEMLDELEWPSLEVLLASLSQDSLWSSVY